MRDIDGLGRLKAADETINQVGHSYTYDYDMRSQLTSAVTFESVSDTYAYDKGGNVQSHVRTPYGSPAETTAYCTSPASFGC